MSESITIDGKEFTRQDLLAVIGMSLDDEYRNSPIDPYPIAQKVVSTLFRIRDWT